MPCVSGKYCLRWLLCRSKKSEKFSLDSKGCCVMKRRWLNTIGLAVAVGLVYFLAARLSVGLLLPEGVAVFWPAAGVSSGVLIALGPRARWPVAAGVTAATVAIHQLIGDPLGRYRLGSQQRCGGSDHGRITRDYFGADFNIVRLRQILGFSGGNRRDHISGSAAQRLTGYCRPVGNNADNVAALVRIRPNRHHHCCAADDRARCRHTATVPPQRNHRRHVALVALR